jgi:hypothetical protein
MCIIGKTRDFTSWRETICLKLRANNLRLTRVISCSCPKIRRTVPQYWTKCRNNLADVATRWFGNLLRGIGGNHRTSGPGNTHARLRKIWIGVAWTSVKYLVADRCAKAWQLAGETHSLDIASELSAIRRMNALMCGGLVPICRHCVRKDLTGATRSAAIIATGPPPSRMHVPEPCWCRTPQKTLAALL